MDSNEVLHRMQQGDMPLLASSYSFQSTFDDGAVVAHQVMQKLVTSGQIGIEEPKERGRPWRFLNGRALGGGS